MSSFGSLGSANEGRMLNQLVSVNSLPTAHARSQEQTTGEWWLNVLGKGEEIPAKFIGRLFTNNPKYDEPYFGNYAGHAGFSDLLTDAGAGPVAATVGGIALAIANPLDWLNKLQVGNLTKLGKASKLAQGAKQLDTLIQTPGKAAKLSDEKIIKALAKHRKGIKSTEKQLVEGVSSDQSKFLKLQNKHHHQAIKNLERSQRDLTDINNLLGTLYKQGVTTDDLLKVRSVADQVKMGHRSLVGFSSPLKMDQLSLLGVGRGALDDSVVAPAMPYALQGKLVEAAGGIKKFSGDYIQPSVERLGGLVGWKKKSAAVKELEANLKQIIKVNRAKGKETQDAMLAALATAIREGVSPTDLSEILQKLELPRAGKQVAIDTLDKFLTGKTKDLNIGKGVVRETGDTALDEAGKLRLSPQGVEDSDIPSAIAAFENSGVSPLRIGSQKEIESKVVGEFVVLKSPAPISDEQLTILDNVYGNRGWIRKEVSGSNESYYVARRMPFSSRVTRAGDLNTLHLQNLEKLAAQLAVNNNYAIAGLTKEDLLISANGSVQIINPTKFVKFKQGKQGKQAALDMSRTFLEKLSSDLGITKGPDAVFPNLGSVTSAKRVSKGVKDLEFRTVAEAAGEIGSETGNYSARAQDVLNQAVNTQVHKQYIDASYSGMSPKQFADEFGSANNVEHERRLIREAVARGENPQFRPVEVVRDDSNLLWVKNGRDRLTAAVLEGFDAIPIKTVDFTGEVLKVEKGYFKGVVDTLLDIWSNNFKALSSVASLSKSAKSIFSNRYSVLGSKGSVIQLKDSDIGADPEFTNALYKLFVAGPQFTKKSVREPRLNAIKVAMVASFGSEANAMVKFAELAENTTDVKVFVEQLEQIIQQSGMPNIRFSEALRHPNILNMFGAIQKSASSSLDSLASRGFLLDSTIDAMDMRRLDMASNLGGNRVGTLHIVDPTTNTLKVVNSNRTSQFLRQSGIDFFNNNSALSNADSFAKIEIHGADVSGEAFKLRELDEVVTPAILDDASPDNVFKISEESKSYLETNGIYVVNKESAEKVKKKLKQKGMNDLGVLLGQRKIFGQDQKIIRPHFTYFITKSGDVVIGTGRGNKDDVSQLLNEVFEEGPRFFQEFGVMVAGRIVLSNPLGSQMERLGLGELRAMTNRLKTIAQRFADLGFSKDTVLDVHVPFDRSIWRSMYGESVTIGKILNTKKKFKLKVNKQFLGHATDNVVAIPHYIQLDPKEFTGVTSLERTRLKNKAAQELFDKIQDANDLAYLEEVKRNLPVAYVEGYFGRHLNKEAKEALNEAVRQSANTEMKAFRNIESFFKGRLFTDLTTLEITEIVKRFQKSFSRGKKEVEHPDKIIAAVVRKYREGYELSIDKSQAKALVKLAESLPEGLALFELNPITATAKRLEKSTRAITRKELVDQIRSSSLAVWEGSPNDLKKARIGNGKEISELQNEIAKLTAARNEVERKLKAFQEKTMHIGSKELDELRDQLKDLTTELASKHSKYAKKVQHLGENGAVMDMMVDFNAQDAFITGDAALDLISRGVLKREDMIGDVGDAFVNIPIQKYIDKLDGDVSSVFLFTPEVNDLVKEYFQATTKEGFKKFLGLYDEVLSTWKAWTLFPIPAYHIRNIISNLFMGWLGGVTRPKVYQDSMHMLSFMHSYRKGKISKEQVMEGLRSMSFVSEAGEVVDGIKMYEAFTHHGGLMGGLTFNEFGNFGNVRRRSDFERAMQSKEARKAGMKPSSEVSGSWLMDNPLIRKGVSSSSWIEDRFRLSAFIDGWQKAKVEKHGNLTLSGFDAAAINMKRIFYDYNDMSAWEKGVLRRVFPFYSWVRHNTPRMLTTMVTDPVKHLRVSQFIDDFERGVAGHVDHNNIPKWIRDRYGVVVSKDEKGQYLIKTAEGLLPLFDAYKVFQGDGIVTMMSDGLVPFVKVPMEQLNNLSWFSDKPIERYAGQRARGFTLGQLGFSRRMTNEGPLGILNLLLNESLFRSTFRVGNETTKLLDWILDPRQFQQEKPGVGTTLLGLAIGRMYVVDPKQARAQIYDDWKRNRSKMVSMLNYANKVGDTKSASDLTSIIAYLDLGNPGVAEV